MSLWLWPDVFMASSKIRPTPQYFLLIPTKLCLIILKVMSIPLLRLLLHLSTITSITFILAAVAVADPDTITQQLKL